MQPSNWIISPVEGWLQWRFNNHSPTARPSNWCASAAQGNNSKIEVKGHTSKWRHPLDQLDKRMVKWSRCSPTHHINQPRFHWFGPRWIFRDPFLATQPLTIFTASPSFFQVVGVSSTIARSLSGIHPKIHNQWLDPPIEMKSSPQPLHSTSTTPPRNIERQGYSNSWDSTTTRLGAAKRVKIHWQKLTSAPCACSFLCLANKIWSYHISSNLMLQTADLLIFTLPISYSPFTHGQ